MAEEVTGSLDGKPVFLNNAATESTLSALLSSNLANQTVLKAMAEKMGVATGSIESFAQAAVSADKLSKTSQETSGSLKGLATVGSSIAVSFYNLERSITPLLNKLVAGTASISDVTSTFGRLNPILGVAANIFEKIVSFQEKNLEAYQQISNAGVSFAGDLTLLRQSAANSYLTLDQFTNVMKSNSDAFIRIGGSVNEGAVAFSKFSNNFISGNLGNQMLALGYTTEQVNQYLATYVGNAGASSSKDLASNQQLREGAANYLEELDRLAQVTGLSREQLDNERKIKNLDADVQLTASRMKDKKERDAFLANYTYMKDLYGVAGADVALAQAQGRSVITKEGAMLTSITSGAVETAMKHLADTGKIYGVGSKEYIEAQRDMSLATSEGVNNIPTVVATANDSLKSALGPTFKTVAQQQMAGLDNREAFDKRDAALQAARNAREQSQAADMAAASKAMKELGQAVLDLVSPIVSLVTPVIKGMAEHLRDIVVGLKKFVSDYLPFILAAGAIYAVPKIANSIGNGGSGITSSALSLVSKFGGSRASKIAGAAASILGKADGSKENPFYVIIASGGGAAGDVLNDLLEGNGKGNGKNTPANRAARLAKVAEGRNRQLLQTAMKNAGKFAKGAGYVGLAIEGVNLVSNLSDIEEKKRKGELSAEDAKKQEGGIIGEFGGGVAGAAAGSAAGAAIGTILFPIVGTAIGGVIGGAIGGFGGGGIGKSIGEWLGTTTKEEDTESDNGQDNESLKKKEKDAREQETLELLRRQTELLMQSTGHLEQQTVHLQGVVNNTNDFRPSWVK